MFFVHQPAPPLALYVEKLWYSAGYQVEHRAERVLPNGRFQIIIDLRDGNSATPPLVIGMQSHYAVVDVDGMQSMMGILLQPGGSRALFDLPSDDFFNQAVPLEAVWGYWAVRLRERLQDAATPTEKFRVLELALQRKIERKRDLHSAIAYGLDVFQREPHIQRVLDVSADAGLGRRRFAQLFREQVGVSPKLYCRILRFQQVVRKVSAGRAVDWAELASATGYYDQAHLAHEFQEFSGMSPSSYAARKQPWVNHIPID